MDDVQVGAVPGGEGTGRGVGIFPFVARRAERGADWVLHRFKRYPYFGVSVAVGATLAVASVVGGAELALTAGVGYLVVQAVRRKVPSSKRRGEAEELPEPAP
jgi:hypothetical protein